jgi:hypothetical protein
MSDELEVVLKFKSKKDFNRFVRNLSHNKGFVVRQEHLKEGGSIGSFFRGIGRTLGGIGKKAAKIALPGLGAVAGDLVGGPLGGVAGMTAGSMASNAIGNGIMQDLKRAGRRIVHGVNKVAKSKEMKHIANSVRPALRELKKIGQEAAHQTIANTAMNMASNLGANDPLKQQAINVIANTAHDKVAGMGLSKSERMAWVRSHRGGKKGGSVSKASSKTVKGGSLASQASNSLGGAPPMLFSNAKVKRGGSFAPL